MTNAPIQSDLAIIGGGVAGLWLHNRLSDLGYRCVLFEKEALGAGQTLASQGMIHGGIKYTLSGFTTRASEEIAAMPAVWRDCLAGQGQLDLSGVDRLSEDYFMFSDSSAGSKLSTFFGSRALRGRISALPRTEYPNALANDDFKGKVYQLQDLVINTSSLLQVLRDRHPGTVFQADVNPVAGEGGIAHLEVGGGQTLTARRYLLCSGAGNENLLQRLNISTISAQRRPLKQVMLSSANLPTLYAHAIALQVSATPRMTITTHYTSDNQPVWYLGGAIAEEGVTLGDEEQIAKTRKELKQLFPWLDLSQAKFATLNIDRAEPGQQEKQRPDNPFARVSGNVQVCWPTKLTLTPALADRVVASIDFSPGKHQMQSPQLPQADVAPPPWDCCGF